jgi:hypothetical protein
MNNPRKLSDWAVLITIGFGVTMAVIIWAISMEWVLHQ